MCEQLSYAGDMLVLSVCQPLTQRSHQSHHPPHLSSAGLHALKEQAVQQQRC